MALTNLDHTDIARVDLGLCVVVVLKDPLSFDEPLEFMALVINERGKEI